MFLLCVLRFFANLVLWRCDLSFSKCVRHLCVIFGRDAMTSNSFIMTLVLSVGDEVKSYVRCYFRVGVKAFWGVVPGREAKFCHMLKCWLISYEMTENVLCKLNLYSQQR